MLFNGNVIIEGDLILGSTADTRVIVDNTGISGGDKTFTFPNDSGQILTDDAAQTMSNKTLTSPVINTGVSGTAVLDDDTMATASATTLATSESIKAYVDNTTGSLTQELTGLTDTDITSAASGNILVYDGTNSWDNKVMSGDIAIDSTGATTIQAGAVEGSMLDAAIAINTTGNITTTAGTFTGDGSGLTNLPTVGSSDSVVLTAKKATAGTITKGTPLYISGYSDPDYLVEAADADDAGKMPAIGIAGASITNLAAGSIIVAGLLEGLDTSLFSVGDELWVSDSSTLTNVKPTGATKAIQKIGQVLVSNASTGVIQVFGAGRSNDIPNLADNTFWLGDGSGVAVATNFDTEVSANSDVTANTSARHTHSNKALLDTYTQTEADLADAVSKKHTQNTDTGTSSTTFEVGNGETAGLILSASGLTTADKTMTFPDASGEVVLKDATQTVTAKILQDVELKDYSESVHDLGTTNGAVTADIENGNVQSITMDGNVTFTFSNPPASGKNGTLTIYAAQDPTGGRSITWPGSVTWAAGSAPTGDTSGDAEDIYTFVTRDGGTTWFGFLSTATDSDTNSIVDMTDSDISSLASGNILIYDGTDSWDNKVLSGDATIDNTGALTVTKINGFTLSGVLDEDNMASDSALHLATQQSIKAYVDSQITGGTSGLTGTTSDTFEINNDGTAGLVLSSTGLTTADKTFTFPDESGEVTTIAATQTLTNKTVDADSNTISNLEVDNFKAGVVIDDDTMATASATTLATSESIKAYVDTEIGNVHTHTNLALLETYTQTEVDLADAVAKKHSHANKALLDTYTQTEADLADAVAKKHTQNTDTGTSSTTFEIDNGGTGVILKVTDGALHVRNDGDSDYADFFAKNATFSGDVTYINSNEVFLTDDILQLNSDVVDNGGNSDGGIEIKRLDDETGTNRNIQSITVSTNTIVLDGTGHGIVAGDYVQVAGATDSANDGYYLVSSVSSADIIIDATYNDLVADQGAAAGTLAKADNAQVLWDESSSAWKAGTMSNMMLLARKYEYTNGAASTTWTITHNLNNQNVIVQVYNTSGEMVIPDTMTQTSSTVCTVTFASAQDGTAVVIG